MRQWATGGQPWLNSTLIGVRSVARLPGTHSRSNSNSVKVEQQFRNDVNFVFLNIDNVKWAAELDEFGVDGIPHYTFLDGEGNEMAYVVGKVPRRILLDNVSALAQGRPELPFSQFISEASDAALRQAPRVVDPRDHGP
ncbi:unnamed protein product [Closterium sp. Naga37s-1]|nr:unnamed protein product [Closterium sp. Naga37s-1]